MTVSFLDSLGPDMRRRVLEGAHRLSFPPGAVLHPDPKAAPLAILLETGLLRIFVESRDGRQASLAYLHPDETYGALSVLKPQPLAAGQAIEASTLVLLDAARLADASKSNLEVALALAREVSERIVQLGVVLAVRSLGSMRQRLAYDLLERASEAQLRSGRLAFQTTQQQLADSIGSSREVVSRLLTQLKEDGIVGTTPGRLVVRNPTALSSIVRGLLYEDFAALTPTLSGRGRKRLG